MFIPYRLLAISLKRIGTWKKYKIYEKALIKLVNCVCRIEFIEDCCQADIIPRFLKFRIPENGCFEPSIVHNFQRNLLKAELVKAKRQKEVHLNNVQLGRTELREASSTKLIPSIVLYTRQAVKTARIEVKKSHARKLKAWSKEQQRPLFDVHDTVKILDADIKPPRYVIDTLALGPKNSTLEKFDSKDTLAQIDSLLYRCKGAKVTTTIMNDINVATFKYIKACSSQKPARNLILTKRYIKKNDLLAVPFDKGIGVCLMKRESYEKKIEDMLKLPHSRNGRNQGQIVRI